MRISDWSSDVCSSDLIIKDIGQATPGLGTVISVAEATRDAARLGTAYKEVRELRDKNAAFAAAKVRRRENIEAAIKTLKADDTKKAVLLKAVALRSEEHTSELQSLMRISYHLLCLTNK